MRTKLAVAAVTLLMLAGCASDAPSSTAGRRESIVHGDDERLEWYEVAREDQRRVMSESVVGLFAIASPDARVEGAYDFRADRPTLLSEGYCSDERFVSQPRNTYCSGTLVDDDLVMTAGHCIANAAECATTAVVFGYYYTSLGVMPERFASPGQVFYCSRIVHREEFLIAEGGPDFAFIKLDRRATDYGYSPARIATVTSFSRGIAAFTAGFPRGLPMKYSLASLDGADGNYIRHDNDTTPGNSGSGLFTTYGSVIGVLSHEYRPPQLVDTCLREPIEAGGSFGNRSFKAHVAIERLCATGYRSARLCGTESVCGDDVCDPDESTSECASDCPSALTVPVEWTCEHAYYGALDGCDCDCGALDPDCGIEGQALYNCDAGYVCDPRGACIDPRAPATEDGGVAPADAGIDASRGPSPLSPISADAGGAPDASLAAPPAALPPEGCSVGARADGSRVLPVLALAWIAAARRRRRNGRSPAATSR